jgi:pSer/pThr/pTyr-binding forkhead associated (FHA) protein
MPFLVCGAERCDLRPGPNVLGGSGEGAVPLAPLATLAPAARIVVNGSGAATVERLASDALLRVDGDPLGAEPRPLRHGARLDVQQCVVSYGDPALAPAPDHAARTELVPAFSASSARGRLVDRLTARSYPLGAAPVAIGRDAACEVVVGGAGVSRRHAVVRAGPEGYVLTDESANGTLVNGEPVATPVLLADGDVVRVGVAEWRFESRPAGAPVPTVAHPRLELGPAAAQPLGTLQITRGPLHGRSFAIERPVCTIGRAGHNDVRLADSSVSSAHATLLLKAGTWYLVDLRSANGTYVDGYRVGAERALSGPCTIRVGSVRLAFTPLARDAAGAARVDTATRTGPGLLRRLASLW